MSKRLRVSESVSTIRFSDSDLNVLNRSMRSIHSIIVTTVQRR